MIPAARSVARAAVADAGVPLPRIKELGTLYDGEFGVKFRRGQTTMIAGESGSQKSGFMLWMALKWNLPTLYFSADLEEHTAMSRLAASITGESTEMVASSLRQNGASQYREALQGSNLYFVYDPDPTIESMWSQIEAFVELFDAYPAVIVLDNLLDLDAGGGENEYSAMKQSVLSLKSLARETSAAVFLLHHMRDPEAGRREPEPGQPAPLTRLTGRISQTAGLILSVALDSSQYRFNVAVVKHRTGKADKTARTYLPYRVDPRTNTFYAWRND